MNLLVKAENWLHMRRHGYPARSAIEVILKNLASNQELSTVLQKRKYNIAHAYAVNGKGLEDIAVFHKITRERVRQVLRRIYFQHGA